MYSKNARTNAAMVAIADIGVSVGQRGVVAINEAGGRLSVMPMDFGPVLDKAMQQIVSAFGLEVEADEKPMAVINRWLNANY